MSRASTHFFLGLRAVSPILLGVAPFGLIAGISVIEAGHDPLDAALFSLLTYAGASQLASLELLKEGTPMLVAALTGLIINMRYLMYSASLAPHFTGRPLPLKAAIAYILSDQSYALSISRYRNDPHMPRRAKLGFYAGAAFGVWAMWQLGTIAGALLGKAVPPELGLEFAVPLTFLALLFQVLADRGLVVAALVGGSLSVALSWMPANTGFLVAALFGIAAGYFARPRDTCPETQSDKRGGAQG